jgi:hypothetical protein
MKTEETAHILVLSAIMLTTKDVLVNSILQKDTILVALVWRHDTQHDDSQHNGILNNNENRRNGTYSCAECHYVSYYKG